MDHNPKGIAIVDKNFGKKPDFKDIELPAKVRDNHKIEKKNSIDISVLVMKLKKNIQSMYQKNFV